MGKFLFICLICVMAFNLKAQTVSGKLVDQSGNGLAGVKVQLYISPKVYSDSTSSTGSFSFNTISGVNDVQLPSGYSVSPNYPNPFNPRTRIDITLPINGNVKVELYNQIGQKVRPDIVKYLTAGNNFMDLELNGLPNGFYIAQITIDGRYKVVKKLMLLYGSQHLITSSTGSNTSVGKTNTLSSAKFTSAVTLDSLVATSTIIGRKVFLNLPNLIGTTLDLGNLTIITDTIPPSIPTGLQMINGDNVVDLNWNSNTENDLAGYNVYISSAYSGKYTPLGKTTANHYTDDKAINGVLTYYAVTAFDKAGNESELSKNNVYATPRPQGLNQKIYDYWTNPFNAGFMFSTQSIVDYTQSDFYFENYVLNGVSTYYLDVLPDTDILDAGATTDIYDIPFAPTTGYSTTKDAIAKVGHTYVIRTWDNHYAKIRIKSISVDHIVFDWAYQTINGNTQL